MADSVDLGERLEAFVSQLLADGHYESRTTVLRESVKLLEERERKLAALDVAIDRGLADIAAGRVLTLDEARTRLEAKFGSAANVDGR
ncbi:type II toxin-antitoxin system ParD family antitoxin [Beijerinckia sp. L45]|uniref:type II toxin-antitoxin system ParD family antitoxin n=1 Tax=Beijerinckia sp. L45 TaxID=1641855 RepID=UPI00131E9785|nr:type II toxin-antitoxin system ParD family antitoxin [Beijerinckia sp. L45]